MIIVLTAGHSQTDPGAVSGGYTEAELMVELRDLTADMLRARGYDVIEDGDDGENLPLRTAIRLIQRGAVAVELHANASSNPAAMGVEAISLPHLRRLSRRLAQRVAAVLGTRVRGDGGWIDQRQSARGRLGYVEAGGIVLEVFFISNPRERATYLQRVQDVAEAIADVLDAELMEVPA